MTFSAFVSALYAGLVNKHSDSLAELRRVTLRALKELSTATFLDMEATTSFQTVAGSNEYDGGTPGFPVDAIEICAVWYLSGSSRVDLRGPAAVRRGDQQQSQYPIEWGWQNNRLQLYPVPSGTVTLYVDFKRDALRDQKTGTLISETSTDETNPWFNRGEPALRASVLAEYYADARWPDGAATQTHLGLRNMALATLEAEHDRKKGSGAQAPMILGDIGRGLEYAGRLPYDFLGGR